MSKTDETSITSIENEECEVAEEQTAETQADAFSDDSEASEDELDDNYKRLSAWQRFVLTILFLFGMAAIIMVIDFIVEFGAELLKKIL